MHISTTKDGKTHQPGKLRVGGSCNHTSISAGWRTNLNGASKRMSLTLNRRETEHLCAALLAVLSDGRREEMATRAGKVGNVTLRYPTFEVVDDERVKKYEENGIGHWPAFDRKPVMFQQLRAPNDSSGNPRRLYVLYKLNGAPHSVIDDGYAGGPEECKGLFQLSTFYIPVSEYNSWLKLGEELEKSSGKQS